MLIAEARVETGQPSRYLVQLCRHVNHKAQSTPRWRLTSNGPMTAEWPASAGAGARYMATPGVLTLRAEAADEATLQRVEFLVADHLERFGRRDHLMVTWTPVQEAGEQQPRHTTIDETHHDRGDAYG